jgi:hypothetical protein
MQPEGTIASNANAATESLILMLWLGFSLRPRKEARFFWTSPPLRYFADRLSFLETNCQKVVTSSTRKAKHVIK